MKLRLVFKFYWQRWLLRLAALTGGAGRNGFFAGRNGSTFQGIEITYKNSGRNAIENQDFFAQKTAHQTPLKGFIYMAKRMVSAPIFTRCGPCRDLEKIWVNV